MRNARLDESQAGIRKVGRNNNFRYANVIILKEESAPAPPGMPQVYGTKVTAARLS